MISRILLSAVLSLLALTVPVAYAVDYSQGESLRVIGTNVIMREEPWQGAAIVGSLNEYDHLTFLGEYTVEPITVRVRGESVTAPYLRVRADSGDEGWVFGGLVSADHDANLLAGKLTLLDPGDHKDDIIRLYGRDYVMHDRRMRSSSTQALLDRLDVDQAWEYYYFRTGEGVAFGLGEDERIQSIRVRQDDLEDAGLTTYWRTVEGFLSDPLRPECHQTPPASSCDDYQH
ncbi:SH3 domain-containing protein [Natronospirillum operosum]|uniref:SH3 domain-containing protein n=1 Tax=Natronospirillum operosum TaxID=2759953 RepID=A0A4Z0W9Q2_9GAMM|nr:SH3 domain-containing protein [Natronospirillum operosum]TGG90195.1 SH3 domain-containing protein [Natronospirillum operosum]